MVPVTEKACRKECSQHTGWSRSSLADVSVLPICRPFTVCAALFGNIPLGVLWKRSGSGLCRIISLFVLQMMIIPLKKPFLLPLVETTVVILDKKNPNLMQYIDVYWYCVYVLCSTNELAVIPSSPILVWQVFYCMLQLLSLCHWGGHPAVFKCTALFV